MVYFLRKGRYAYHLSFGTLVSFVAIVGAVLWRFNCAEIFSADLKKKIKIIMRVLLFLVNVLSEKTTHYSARWGRISCLGFVMLFECQKHHFPSLEIYQIFRNNLSWSQMKESGRKLMGTDLLGWISPLSTVHYTLDTSHWFLHKSPCQLHLMYFE